MKTAIENNNRAAIRRKRTAKTEIVCICTNGELIIYKHKKR